MLGFGSGILSCSRDGCGILLRAPVIVEGVYCCTCACSRGTKYASTVEWFEAEGGRKGRGDGRWEGGREGGGEEPRHYVVALLNPNNDH